MNSFKTVSRRLMLMLVSVGIAYVAFAAVMVVSGAHRLCQSGMIS
jgi:hypothetical protein